MAIRSEDAKTERLALRASRRDRELFAAASRTEGSNLSEFVLRHARIAALNVLADRRVFSLSRSDWARFQATLDRPPRDLPDVRKLIENPSVLEQE